MTEDGSTRKSFLRRLGAFAAAGVGVAAFPSTAFAATLCCPHKPGDPCQQGEVWCRGNCGPYYCDPDPWCDGQCHTIGC
jgi:hypothetical protein